MTGSNSVEAAACTSNNAVKRRHSRARLTLNHNVAPGQTAIARTLLNPAVTGDAGVRTATQARESALAAGASSQ